MVQRNRSLKPGRRREGPCALEQSLPVCKIGDRLGSLWSKIIRRTNEDARDRSLWRPTEVNSQVTQPMNRPIQPCDEAPSFLGSCTLKLRRLWIFEFPRISHLRRYWRMKLRVTPNLHSFNIPDDESSGYPEFCIFRLCRR
jgi:hypothetical protein